jgi:hypothetical protein
MDTSLDPRYNFDANPTLDELIAQQGKVPVADVHVLQGGFWPEDDPLRIFSRPSMSGAAINKPILPHE